MIAGAGLGLASTFLNRAFARKDWRDQNKYNHPAAQRERLEQAGLNPALMYGSGASGGNAGPITTPQHQLNGMEYLSQMAQIRNTRAQTELIKKQTMGVDVATRIQQIEKDLIAANRDYMLSPAFEVLKRSDGTVIRRQTGRTVFEEMQDDARTITMNEALVSTTTRKIVQATSESQVSAVLEDAIQKGLQNDLTREQLKMVREKWKIFEDTGMIERMADKVFGEDPSKVGDVLQAIYGLVAAYIRVKILNTQ